MDALKILVVDDESRMRKLVKDFLSKKNYQVLEAGDGEEAMDIFYNTKVCSMLHDKRYGLYLMSDLYIVHDILAELQNRQ